MEVINATVHTFFFRNLIRFDRNFELDKVSLGRIKHTRSGTMKMIMLIIKSKH